MISVVCQEDTHIAQLALFPHNNVYIYVYGRFGYLFPLSGVGSLLGPFCLLLLERMLLWGWSLCFHPRPSPPQIYLLISSFNSIGKSCTAILALYRPKNPAAKWRELFVREPVNFWSFLKSCLPPLRPNKEEYPDSNEQWMSFCPAG